MDERRSYSSFAGSAALHGVLLALLLLGFARAPRFTDSPESIPIETVSLSDLNQIMNGEKDAKPAPQPPPSPPTPPQPPADLRASAEPTPPLLAIGGLIVLTLVVLAAASVRARKLEINYGTD